MTKHPIPKASRPYIAHEGYGIPKDEDGMLSWEWVVERIKNTRNVWVSTTRPDGRPHAIPVWSVWVDDTLYHGGGSLTRRAQNLDANSNVVIHLESGDEVVILEGTVEKLTDETIDPALLERIDDAYEAKYDMRHGTPLWRLSPRVVFAWSEFPVTTTRWVFDHA